MLTSAIKKVYVLLAVILLIDCSYDYRKPIYNVNDIVIIEPDSSSVIIFDYTIWSDYVKYSVKYLDTNTIKVILEEEIIGYKNY